MRRFSWIPAIFLLLLLMALAITQGSTAIPLADLWHDPIIWSIRIPRVLMAVLSGAGLSLVGASVQALLRNPMADPWLLGVSSGASFGAVLVLVVGIRLFGSLSLPVMAFLGALLASALIYRFARTQASLSSMRLIFMGLAISFCLEACTQIFIFSADHSAQVQNMMFWTMGSLGGAEMGQLPLPLFAVSFGFIFLYRKRQELNIACLSETKAHSLGLDLTSFRLQIFVLAAGMTSVLVSFTGSIGFVGLMVPHLLRQLLGNDYRRLIPACLIGGALFMVTADFMARVIFEPREIPIGVLTALLGSPLFIWLLRRSHA